MTRACEIRDLSLSLSFFPMSVFSKNSRHHFFFQKIFSPFSLRFVLVSPHCRTHTRTRTNIARERNERREDGRCARFTSFFFSLSVSRFVCERFLSSFFLNISSSFFPNNTNNNLSFLRVSLSQNDRRRGVPRQPARRFRRRRF